MPCRIYTTMTDKPIELNVPYETMVELLSSGWNGPMRVKNSSNITISVAMHSVVSVHPSVNPK